MVARLGREIGGASGVAGEEAKPLVVERDAERPARASGCGGGGRAEAHERGRPIPHDDGTGDQITQPLPARVKRDEGQAEQVGRREEVGDPKQVAECRGAQRDRMAGFPDHSDADLALARRLAAAEPFEQDEVAVAQCEGQSDNDRADPGGSSGRTRYQPKAAQDGGQQPGRKHDRSDDGAVDDRRHEPGAHAGDLQVEHDVLGGLRLRGAGEGQAGELVATSREGWLMADT